MDSLQQVNRNWGLRYSNSVEKTLHINSDLFIDSFKKKIQGKLSDFEAQSVIENDTIRFRRVVKYLILGGMNRSEAMKILREGKIRIEKIDSKRIRISWEVHLDGLLFLSISIGLLIGILVVFAGSLSGISLIYGMLFAIIIAMLFSVSIYFIGCSVIKSQIDKIVEASI
jgi:hypothetical protein